VTGQPAPDHYSYTYYADRENARAFDERRFGGPIGELIAATQARVLANMVGRIHERPILDVGTGTGRAAIMFARGGAKVTAIDASEEMLAIARERSAAEGVAVTFLVGDAHALEFADRAFDVAVSLRVLMHTPRWQTVVKELCRVADRLVIIDYPSSRSAARVQSMARRAMAAAGVSTEPYHVFSDQEIGQALADEGFRVRSMHRLFALPIAFHKMVGSRRFTTALEGALARAGLRKRFGSPVTLVAERCVIS
jgi:2-polyprenyl-3-methyl-5-hydroxy-6-metoxy-1,4-benzoquinol methylase